MTSGKVRLFAFALLLALPVWAQSPAQQDNSAPAAAAQAQMLHAIAASKPSNGPTDDPDRITHKVSHELVRLPYYSMWDWLAFRVDGSTVELLGDVHTVGLKRDAVNAVQHVEGVETVIDHMNQLPPSPADDRIRKQVARAIFDWGNLSHYALSPVPSIHIIVNMGRVWLEGVVDSEPDKNAAGLRANGVSGVFQVTNELHVVER